MYTVRRNILIEQYYFYFDVQCPWAIFDLVEIIYSHVCMFVCFPHPEDLLIKFLSLIQIKGREQ